MHNLPNPPWQCNTVESRNSKPSFMISFYYYEIFTIQDVIYINKWSGPTWFLLYYFTSQKFTISRFHCNCQTRVDKWKYLDEGLEATYYFDFLTFWTNKAPASVDMMIDLLFLWRCVVFRTYNLSGCYLKGACELKKALMLNLSSMDASCKWIFNGEYGKSL